MTAPLAPVYDRPDLYAAAYGWRDIDGEVDCALAWAARHLGRAPGSACELAAGPALHARALLARGLRVAAVEHNPAACAWLRAAAPSLEVLQADLTAFGLAVPVDLMLCPLSGLSYLLDDAAWQTALRCIAGSLAAGGVLVAELAPGDAERTAEETWTVPWAGASMQVSAGPSRWVGPDVFEWELRLDPPGRDHSPFFTTERQRYLPATTVEALLASADDWASIGFYTGYDARQRYRGGPSYVVCAVRAG